MAREIQEIETEILKAKQNEPALSKLDSSSKVAIWRLFIYIIATVIYTLEKLFDFHSNDVDFRLSQQKAHTLRWYRNKALDFQYGFNLIKQSDLFDNTNKTEEEIQASKIIKYAAVTEGDDETLLILKIATEKDGLLSPVTDLQHNTFQYYLSEFRDAGVKVNVINFLPDFLRLKLRIRTNKLLLDTNGMDILSGEYPVNNIIQQFLKKLPFNGNLSIQKLEEKILLLDGVEDLSIDLAETAWIDAKEKKYGDWQSIDISTIPVSGYFTINITETSETQSTITYV